MILTDTAEKKTAIILIGGAMRSSYSGGFLCAFANQLLLRKPDIMIGSSADSGNVLYFCAEQYRSIKRIWLELLSTPKFISLKRIYKIMNVDYVIDTVFKQQEPLDVRKARSSETDWYIALTDVDYGEVRYANKYDTLDIFELLRAAKAVPFLYNKKIILPSSHGMSHYFDGEFGATLDTHIQHVTNLGATHILIIKNNVAGSWYRILALRLYMLTLPVLTQTLLEQDMEQTPSLESFTNKYPTVTIKLCSPHVPASIATRSAGVLKNTFEQGERDALAMEAELRMLFTI